MSRPVLKAKFALFRCKVLRGTKRGQKLSAPEQQKMLNSKSAPEQAKNGFFAPEQASVPKRAPEQRVPVPNIAGTLRSGWRHNLASMANGPNTALVGRP